MFPAPFLFFCHVAIDEMRKLGANHNGFCEKQPEDLDVPGSRGAIMAIVVQQAVSFGESGDHIVDVKLLDLGVDVNRVGVEDLLEVEGGQDGFGQLFSRREWVFVWCFIPSYFGCEDRRMGTVKINRPVYNE